MNFHMLPLAVPEIETTKDHAGQMDVWAHERGEAKGGGEKVEAGITDDPVLPIR